jgi:hypothetical protein
MFDIFDNPCATWSILGNAVENCNLGPQEVCDYTEWAIDQGKGEWIYSIGICNDVPNVSGFNYFCRLH